MAGRCHECNERRQSQFQMVVSCHLSWYFSKQQQQNPFRLNCSHSNAFGFFLYFSRLKFSLIHLCARSNAVPYSQIYCIYIQSDCADWIVGLDWPQWKRANRSYNENPVNHVCQCKDPKDPKYQLYFFASILARWLCLTLELWRTMNYNLDILNCMEIEFWFALLSVCKVNEFVHLTIKQRCDFWTRHGNSSAGDWLRSELDLFLVFINFVPA